MKKTWGLLFFILTAHVNVGAHGDLHQRILEVTQEIKINPNNANLYAKRGKLYYQHNNFIESLEDLRKAKNLGEKGDDHYFLMAKCNFHLKRYHKSKKLVNKLLRDSPNNPVILKLLADIYFVKQKFKKSAEIYEKVIYFSKETFPESYINASDAWNSTKSMEGIKKSQLILINGIEVLGDNMVLYDQLVSNYLKSGNYVEAVNVQSKIVDISIRKERAYLKLARIQEMQQKYSDALVSLKSAKKHYQSLPFRIKNATFMKEFYSELNAKEESLKIKNQ